MTSRSFHLGDILSVTTGVFLSPSKDFGAVYEILNYLTGADLYTHQLPGAADAVKGAVEAELPFLKDIEVPAFEDADAAMAWLATQVETYGESFTLAPVEGYVQTDPLADLVRMMG